MPSKLRGLDEEEDRFCNIEFAFAVFYPIILNEVPVFTQSLQFRLEVS